MSLNRIKFFVILLLLVCSILLVLNSGTAQAITPTFSPTIPRVWDDAEMATLQLPLVDSTASPKQISSDYYYRIPIRMCCLPHTTALHQQRARTRRWIPSAQRSPAEV